MKSVTRKKMSDYSINSIHQVLPFFSLGSTISNQAIYIRDLLISKGYNSRIFVERFDRENKKECSLFQSDSLKKNDGLIYHHSMEFSQIKNISNHKGKSALIYHNITPHDFYEPYNKDVALSLKHGRKQLKELVHSFNYNLGDSYFNVQELINSGFRSPEVLPLVFTPEKLYSNLNSDILKKYSDGKINLLFTGKISPNKKQTDLVKMLAYLKCLRDDIRLILIGEFEKDNSYCYELLELIKQYKLQDDVIITGIINDSELKSFYKVSDMFISMSEHEGFASSLIEAMLFDLPVVAYKSTSIPETLGDSAFMFNEKRDMGRVASLINYVIDNKACREAIIVKQHSVRNKYTKDEISHKYDKLIKRLTL